MRRWFEYPVMPVNVRLGATTDAFLDEILSHLRPDTEDATYLDQYLRGTAD